MPGPAPRGWLRPKRRSLVLGILLGLFLVTRVTGAWLADRPDRYRSGDVTVSGDVDIYERWAAEVGREDRAAYGDVRIEYPPGSLPFILAPSVGADGHAYRPRFIAVMVLVDAFGLLGLVVMARRTGSWWGPGAWTVLVPLLGPVAWLRLDLVPAVATIWALERSQAGAWAGLGAGLGFGAVAKVYPGLLLPLALASRWRWRTVLAAAGVAVVGLLPFAGSLDGLWDSVVGYHSQRGVQVESTWGAALLAAGHLDRPVEVVFDHGAFHVRASGASASKALSLGLSVGAVVAGVAITRKRVGADSTVELAAAMAGTLALLLAVGTVFSPQFMLWLSALGAVAAGVAGRTVRALWVPLLLVAVANALSQALYPFHYAGLLANRLGPLTLLLARNAVVAMAGVLLLVGVWRRHFGGAASRIRAETYT